MYGGPAPGTLSPDGNYYWSGTAWVPISGWTQRPSSKKQVRYAGFWRRVAAYLIDVALIAIVWALLGVATNGNGIPQGAGALWVIRLVSLFYFVLMESSMNQATLGKMALRIYVIDLQGNPISFGKALSRNIGKYISFLICFIGVLMVPFSATKQALHDRISGTYVVRA